MTADDSATHDLLVEYALDALEPRRLAEVGALLASSASARDELRAIQAELVTMVEALPQHAPSDDVRGSVVAAVAAEARARAVRPPARRAGSTRPRSPRTPRRPGPLARRPIAWIAAFAVVVTLGVGVWGGVALRTIDRLTHERQRIAAALNDPSMQRVALFGTPEPGGSEVALGTVLRDDGRAVFVLLDAPPRGAVYQAWGHTSNEWEPGGDERLTSLHVSRTPVFEVETGPFAALYLSVEPRGGSDQPTHPVARVSLLDPVADRPLVIVQPESGAATQGSVIVQGVVDSTVASVRYSLNDGAPVDVAVAGSRFVFTLADLRPGLNTVSVSATLRSGETLNEVVHVTAP